MRMTNHIYFKDKVYLKNGKIIPTRVGERFIKNNYIDLYESIIIFSNNNNIDVKPFSKVIWHYMYGPIIPLCKTCNINEPKWDNFSNGYRRYCSIKCVSNSEEVIKKVKKTNLYKFGYEYASQNIDIKDKVKKTNLNRHGVEYILQSKEIREKSKITNLERYGTEYASQSNIIKNKIKETSLAKYGVEHYLSSIKVIEKRYKTNLERYGFKNPMSSKEVQKKVKDTNLERYGKTNYKNSDECKHKESLKRINKLVSLGIKKENIINVNNYITIKCEKCKDLYTATNYFLHQRLVILENDPCLYCNPLNSNEYTDSKGELELLQFIKDNYKGTIIEGDRKILERKELDIFLPDLGLAFEFNGVYWHSELHKDKDYHLDKTNNCLKKNIHLIHIYEDDWNYKRDIVKSRILNLLSKSKRIYARKTEIREVDSEEVRTFLNDNHIQGFIGSSVKLGLYYKVSVHETDDLVSLMTFGGLRKNLGQVSKEGSYELLRFCNSLNTTVIGGASKLFKHFIKNYLPKDIISYADRSWSKGGLYENLGFSFVKNTVPNYQYVIGDIRKNRFGYRKDVLVKEGYDSNMTEKEIMLNRKKYRIYDSGSIKFIFKIDKIIK